MNTRLVKNSMNNWLQCEIKFKNQYKYQYNVNVNSNSNDNGSNESKNRCKYKYDCPRVISIMITVTTMMIMMGIHIVIGNKSVSNDKENIDSKVMAALDSDCILTDTQTGSECEMGNNGNNDYINDNSNENTVEKYLCNICKKEGVWAEMSKCVNDCDKWFHILCLCGIRMDYSSRVHCSADCARGYCVQNTHGTMYHWFWK